MRTLAGVSPPALERSLHVAVVASEFYGDVDALAAAVQSALERGRPELPLHAPRPAPARHARARAVRAPDGTHLGGGARAHPRHAAARRAKRPIRGRRDGYVLLADLDAHPGGVHAVNLQLVANPDALTRTEASTVTGIVVANDAHVGPDACLRGCRSARSRSAGSWSTRPRRASATSPTSPYPPCAPCTCACA